MKKLFKLAIVTAVVMSATIFTFTSCSSDEENSMILDQKDFVMTKLENDLDNFTQKFTSENPTSPKSRFLGLKRFWKSVKADYHSRSCAFGVCHDEYLSISASRRVWDEERKALDRAIINTLSTSSTNNQQDLDTDKLKEMLTELKSRINSGSYNDGDIHNAVLIQTILDYPDRMGDEDVVTSVLDSYKKVGLSTPIANINETVNDLEYFINEIYDESDDIICERMVKNYPSHEREIRLLNNLFKQLEDYDDISKINDLANGYKKIVESSSIDNNLKEIMVSSLEIAPASYELWSNVDLK